MSLSFNSLRSIMIIHYLFVFGFQGTSLLSNNRNGTRKPPVYFVTCFALCFIPIATTYKQAWRGVSCVETHCSLLAWRWWDSNSWPPACKAGALPTELHPHGFFFILFYQFFLIMGLNGLEPSTSRLSGVHSNLLSYKPMAFMPRRNEVSSK